MRTFSLTYLAAAAACTRNAPIVADADHNVVTLLSVRTTGGASCQCNGCSINNPPPACVVPCNTPAKKCIIYYFCESCCSMCQAANVVNIVNPN
jgi:hypothetical protein